jgi:tripeptidyl-peptidase-1
MAVNMWLVDAGIHKARIRQSASLNWIEVNTTIFEAEKLLKTEYHIFDHMISGQPQVACHEYHLPQHVTKHVDFITPTVHFDTPLNLKHRRSLPADAPQLKHKREIRKRNVRTLGEATEQAEFDGPIPRYRPGIAAEVGTNLGSLPKQGATLADEEVSREAEQLDRCDRQITPACLRTLYGFNQTNTATTNPKNSFGIVEYSPQTYIQSDLDKYFDNFSSIAKGMEPVLRGINGGVLLPTNRSFNVNGESNLDLEIAMALVAPMKVTLYQVGDSVQGASFNNFLDAVDGEFCKFNGGDDKEQDAIYPAPPDGYIGPANCGGFEATKVISTSYGYNEADLTPAYTKRQCSEYLKLALQGVTVLYSSGDFGVAGNMGRCIDPATGNFTRTNATEGVFNPSFPGGCPWVTSVGATEVARGVNIKDQLAQNKQPEKACETVIRSGGGFSNVFELPEYQQTVVKKWFSEHPPPYGADKFNNTQRTRGFPDISTNGANYVVTVNGNFTLIYGTSASAPALGGMISLINEQRLNANKGTIGFINPVLYEHPEYVPPLLPQVLLEFKKLTIDCRMMKDVTEGKNGGCGTPGFNAAPGWDPATGLGTPIFPKMLEVFMALP